MADRPKKREIYACHHGDYAGQMFAFINKEEQSYNFLRMPDMKNISVPCKDFYNGVRKEILQLVETVPGDVYRVIQAQYKKNENTDN